MELKRFENISLTDRNDVAEALLAMVRPLKARYSPGGARLYLGSTAAHYGENSAEMEGFARVLWGLGPLFAGDNGKLSKELQGECEEWLTLYRKGIVNGTDLDHEEYWGELLDYDQKMVEMASLATAISLSPEKLWTPLTKKQQENLYQWLNQINEKQVHPNNWRFFRILVNMLFRLLGLPWSQVCLEDDFRVIEGCYTKEGWYFDGNPGQVDYYIPFAMHFYGLVYAGFMETLDPVMSMRLKARADEFSKTWIYWFANDGNEIPFGRSLTYRFAHGAFFPAMAFAGIEGPGYGVMRHLALKNLETWLKRPIFDSSGILSIGYGYPNLYMSERYNAPGSPYWAFKTFFMLTLPEEHPFWTAEPEEYPFARQKLLAEPHMLVTHDEHNMVMAFVTGQHAKNHGYSQEKYEKFVYSNQFGFSVPRGHGLEEGAFDNTLAVSLSGDGYYRMRDGVEEFRVEETNLYMKYRIMPGVWIESTIVPCAPWHVRIHRIRTELAVDIADGGFAIESESRFWSVEGNDGGRDTYAGTPIPHALRADALRAKKYDMSMVRQSANSLAAVFPWGTSGVVSYTGGTCALVTAYPNTNLLYHLTVIPSVKLTLEPGEHLVVTGVMGDRSMEGERRLERRPEVFVEGDKVSVYFDGECVVVGK